MNIEIPDYSERLRVLTEDYYHRHLTLQEYRLARQAVLERVDAVFNKVAPENPPDALK